MRSLPLVSAFRFSFGDEMFRVGESEGGSIGLLRELRELTLSGDDLAVEMESPLLGKKLSSFSGPLPLGDPGCLPPYEDLSELLRGVDDTAELLRRSSPIDSSLGGERMSTLESRRMFDEGRIYDGRVFFTESASLVLLICLKDTAPEKIH